MAWWWRGSVPRPKPRTDARCPPTRQGRAAVQRAAVREPEVRLGGGAERGVVDLVLIWGTSLHFAGIWLDPIPDSP